MTQNPDDPFPILRTDHTSITPCTAGAFLLLIQKNSDADKALLNLFAEKTKGADQQECPTCHHKSGPKIDFQSFPQFSVAGVGMIGIADTAWIAIVRRGIKDGQGPNLTEESLMEFQRKFGRKVPRK